MKILFLDTSKPMTEIGLYEDDKLIEMDVFEGYKTLSSLLLTKIESLLTKHQIEIKDLGGIVCFTGPGSFTGLRIGISMANSISYSLNIPIAQINKDQEYADGYDSLINNQNKRALIPFYGAEPHITTPKK